MPMHVSVVSVFAFLALLSVIFRLWARRIKSVRLELNDYLCMGGLVYSPPQVSTPLANLSLDLRNSFDCTFSALYVHLLILDASYS